MIWLLNLLCWAYVNIGMIKKFWNVMEGSVQLFTMGEIRRMFNFTFTWFHLNWNLCWTFHYISELFNHTNVHISSTEDVRLMPRKIRETFRKSTRPTAQALDTQESLGMNPCAVSIDWSNLEIRTLGLDKEHNLFY